MTQIVSKLRIIFLFNYIKYRFLEERDIIYDKNISQAKVIKQPENVPQIDHFQLVLF